MKSNHEPVASVEAEASPSPWSIGSNAVFETAVASVPEVEEAGNREASTSSPPPRQGIRTRTVAVLTAVAVLLAVVVVGRSILITDSIDDVGSDAVGSIGTSIDLSTSDVDGTSQVLVTPLVAEPFAGADARRLPMQLEQRWRAEVAGVSATGRAGMRVLGSDAVVGVFDVDSTEDLQVGSVVVMLDGGDGSELWRAPFDIPARALDVLADVDGVVVIERRDADNHGLFGYAADSGAVEWVRDADEPGTYASLDGTPLVVHVPTARDQSLTFIDPTSGASVGRASGRLIATDHLGTWFVRSGSVVSGLDLRDGWRPPTILETIWVDDDEPASVVGERVVVIDDGFLEIRGDGGYPTHIATVGVGSGGFAGLDTGANFSQLFSMVGDAFVIVGSRSVFGARLDENGDADVRWRATGTPIESRPTDRGLSLVLATEGGGSQRVVDASTGREIAVIEIVPGSMDALRLVGNGVVLKRSALVGFERVGIDLDGNRLWSLVGDGPLAIGSGVVVTAGPSGAGIAITAFGEPVS